MSEIFEGVLLSRPLAEVQETLRRDSLGLTLASEPLGSGSVVYRTGRRSEAQFTAEVDRLGMLLTREGGKALVVRYDSRVGHRSSKYIVDGTIVKDLGEEDEIFVLLDDDGEPIVDGRRFAFEELDDLGPDEEVETTQNAIQLGLKLVDVAEWRELKDLISRV